MSASDGVYWSPEGVSEWIGWRLSAEPNVGLYNDDKRAAVVAASFEPGVTMREVARRFGIAESLLDNWCSAQRKAMSLAAPMQCISYNAIPGIPADTAFAPALALPQDAPLLATELNTRVGDEPVCPAPGARPGSIDITLPSGVHLSVDRFVNEKALARCFAR